MMRALDAPAHRSDPELTVVIPTLGREILRRSLEAFEQGTVWPARIVVVDQGRRPEISALMDEVKTRGLDTLWVASSDKGRAAGINRGIERAVTPFVAVTDDDCLVQSDWIELLGRRLRQNPDSVITGRVEAGDSETVLLVLNDPTASVQRRPALRFDRLVGANMALARDLMLRLGGLDEDQCMRTAEDGEFAYRALRAGVPIMYCPEIAVIHLGWRDDRQREDQYESYARSQGGFYGKYLRRGDLFIALRAALHLTRAARRWAFGVLRGRREAARIGRAYATGLIPGIVAGWRSGARG